MKRELLPLLLLLGLSFTLTCCGEKTPTISESPLASPLSTMQSPLSVPSTPVVPFLLDKPIVVGATRVTGSGPSDVPIMLSDITFGGPVLAMGTIDRDGRFELELGKPLEANHRIGITLGNLTGTRWQPEDFFDKGFHGDQALSVPQIGFFFDTYMIRE